MYAVLSALDNGMCERAALQSKTADELIDAMGRVWSLWLEISEHNCVEEGDKCSDGYVCVELTNPANGFISFDDFLKSMLTCITIITGEGWSVRAYVDSRAACT